MHDFFDQSEHMKALELSRYRRRSDVQVCQQIGTAPAVDVELSVLQSSQQRLVVGVEEVHALNAGIVTRTRLTQALQITLAGAGVIRLDRNAG
jgi:hypothetical protein